MFHNVSMIGAREIVNGYKARFIHTDGMTIAFWEVEAGAVMPVHQHIHEQCCNILEGRFQLSVYGEDRVTLPESSQPSRPRFRTGVLRHRL